MMCQIERLSKFFVNINIFRANGNEWGTIVNKEFSKGMQV